MHHKFQHCEILTLKSCPYKELSVIKIRGWRARTVQVEPWFGHLERGVDGVRRPEHEEWRGGVVRAHDVQDMVQEQRILRNGAK